MKGNTQKQHTKRDACKALPGQFYILSATNKNQFPILIKL